MIRRRTKMSKVQKMRELVNQRQTAAVREILQLFERTVEEYETELIRSQEENARLRRLLEATLNPEVQLQKADIQLLLQQEWSQKLYKQEPEPLHIKEEHEELWTSQEGEQLQHLHLKEADTTKFPFTSTLSNVKSEDGEEKVQNSQLHQSQTEENRKAEPPASSSTEQTETGAHVEDCGGPGPSRNLDPGSSTQPATDVEASASSEPQTKDSEEDGKETEEPQSSLTTQKMNDVPESDMQCNSDDNFFCCSECGAPYKYLISLKIHMRSHAANGPLSCSFCGKVFKLSGDLKSHIKIHTGEKPFSCPFCDQNFRRPDALTSHMRIHKGGKPHLCSECGKRFAYHKHLRRHMLIHAKEKQLSLKL